MGYNLDRFVRAQERNWQFFCGFRAEAGRHSDQLPATVPI